jgi:FAD:protein FMN transferase
MTHVVRAARTAMACLCEVFVVHDSLAEASRAAEAALEEIGRVESLLSRFDPASEVSRINRDAARGPVMVDHELFALLSRCVAACQTTRGAFDITAGITREAWRLMESQHSIQFENEHVQLDLGGCGKGYALDCAGAVLRAAGVTRAALHAGTSSVLAIGTPPDDVGWPIALVDPRDRSREVTRVKLADRGLEAAK